MSDKAENGSSSRYKIHLPLLALTHTFPSTPLKNKKFQPNFFLFDLHSLNPPSSPTQPDENQDSKPEQLTKLPSYSTNEYLSKLQSLEQMAVGQGTKNTKEAVKKHTIEMVKELKKEEGGLSGK